jgi:hypothetical protein
MRVSITIELLIDCLYILCEDQLDQRTNIGGNNKSERTAIKKLDENIILLSTVRRDLQLQLHAINNIKILSDKAIVANEETLNEGILQYLKAELNPDIYPTKEMLDLSSRLKGMIEYNIISKSYNKEIGNNLYGVKISDYTVRQEDESLFKDFLSKDIKDRYSLLALQGPKEWANI